MRTVGIPVAFAVWSLALALAPGAAHAVVPVTVTVTVGGTQYDVTYSEFDYSTNSARFATLANGGQMPWWGDATLTTAFAVAVGTSLGTPNRISNPNDAGPYFGFDQVSFLGNPLVNMKTFTATGALSFAGIPATTLYNYATATLTPQAPASSVPAPLPLFGAAAAFGAGRRLRRRLQQGS